MDYKLYKLSQIAVWRDYWRFSGVQLKFEVPSYFTGYPPIIKTIGSTRLASLYTVLDNQYHQLLSPYALSFDSEGDGGLGKINLGHGMSVKSDNHTNSTTWGWFRENFIGLRADLGASRDGTIQNMRNFRLLVD